MHLAPLLFSLIVHADVGVPRACAVKSPELKLARECFTGDMREDDEALRFVGLDEGTSSDLNYCFNAFVIPEPVTQAQLPLTVFKDDPKGHPIARRYAVNVGALAASLGQVPTNRRAQILRLTDLSAPCYARTPATDVCGKAFFGFGGSDLPFALLIEGGPAEGYRVKGGARDRALIEKPGVAAVQSKGRAEPQAMLDYLTVRVRDRLLARARKDLAQLGPAPTEAARDQVARKNQQFRYCRLAFDGLTRALKRPDPFADAERKLFDDLDERLNPGERQPAADTPN